MEYSSVVQLLGGPGFKPQNQKEKYNQKQKQRKKAERAEIGLDTGTQVENFYIASKVGSMVTYFPLHCLKASVYTIVFFNFFKKSDYNPLS